MKQSTRHHCTNAKCKNHGNETIRTDRYVRIRSYKTKLNGRIDRSQCLDCGLTFSEPTFSTDAYPLKQTDYAKLIKTIAKQNLKAKKKDIVKNANIPFCTNGKCDNHKKELIQTAWFDYFGSYETKISGTIYRFLCLECGTTFSERTFSIDYYTKKKVDYEKLIEETKKKTKPTHIAKEMNVTTNTVSNRLERLTRAIAATQAELLKIKETPEKNKIEAWKNITVSGAWPYRIETTNGIETELIYGLKYTQGQTLATYGNNEPECPHAPDESPQPGNINTGYSRNVCAMLNRQIVAIFYTNHMASHRRKNETKRTTELINQTITRRFFLKLESMPDFFRRLWLKQIPTPGKRRAEYLPGYALGRLKTKHRHSAK